ncbi:MULTISPECIES: hypothetical protein [unclassified Variovorax]|uniref:hypothetical protein n=1 Tax=unclassified Variovorax TaxID=663243 RepID=UPI0032E61E03
MTTAEYNPWYGHTYEVIQELADWRTFSRDIPKKVMCIYSWMPQTLMSVKHAGGGTKWSAFSLEDIERLTKTVDSEFAAVQSLELQKANLEELEGSLRNIASVLFPPFGPVAMSKYLHFSAPTLFPMWDRRIRSSRKHAATVDGYLEYMRVFKEELMEASNMEKALSQYPSNAVRGWDIVNMMRRAA